jgi:ornithine cyclodeaminase/alanine dehydrogenase-like protein (mu-crystallin family)
MKSTPTILLTGSEVASLLPLDECITAIEKAFKLYGEGKAAPPGILGIHTATGGFHIKAGVLNLNKAYFVAKINANYPGNPGIYGLPTIQGVVAIYDADNGRLLGLMDSIQLTAMRTGAATAVATRYLSRSDCKVAAIIGCGKQGNISLRMVSRVRRLRQVYVYDSDPE